MSRHAQISPAATSGLAAKRRNSAIAAVIVSLLFMALIAIIFLFIFNYTFTPIIAPIATVQFDEILEHELKRDTVQVSIKRKPTSP